MITEIDKAAAILTHFAIHSKLQLNDSQLSNYKLHLVSILQAHYANHWYPTKPFTGSAYRCIRVNTKLDPLIVKAALLSDIDPSKLKSIYPNNFALWVDPHLVSYRIGLKGYIFEYNVNNHTRSCTSLACTECKNNNILDDMPEILSKYVRT